MVDETSAQSVPGDRAQDQDYLDTQVHIWRGRQHVVIACRGMQQLPSDAITDAAVWEAKWPHAPGKVPWGFYDAFEQIRGELDKQLKPAGMPVFITGHSLGGGGRRQP